MVDNTFVEVGRGEIKRNDRHEKLLGESRLEAMHVGISLSRLLLVTAIPVSSKNRFFLCSFFIVKIDLEKVFEVGHVTWIIRRIAANVTLSMGPMRPSDSVSTQVILKYILHSS